MVASTRKRFLSALCLLTQYNVIHLDHHCFNSLRPRLNRRHFADDISKCILLNENVLISINISLKFIPKGPINYILALVQIMAWHRPGDKPLSEPMVINSLTHICATQPQWVKWYIVVYPALGHYEAVMTSHILRVLEIQAHIDLFTTQNPHFKKRVWKWRLLSSYHFVSMPNHVYNCSGHTQDHYLNQINWHGPLTRYVTLRVAHAPGMPGTLSLAADSKGNR